MKRNLRPWRRKPTSSDLIHTQYGRKAQEWGHSTSECGVSLHRGLPGHPYKGLVTSWSPPIFPNIGPLSGALDLGILGTVKEGLGTLLGRVVKFKSTL